MDTGEIEKGGLVSGADVSKWQGKFNFQGLKEAGYSFCIIKASEGVQYTDPRFRENWKRAREAGLIIGAYHFARASVIDLAELNRDLGRGKLTQDDYDKKRRAGLIQDAEDEASWFWSVIESVGGLDDDVLPPCLDIEWDKRANEAGITSKETVIWSLAFLTKLEELCGVVPMVYTGKNYWRYKLRQSKEFFRYPLWLVQYSRRGRSFGKPSGQPPKPIPGWEWKLWQWSGGGKAAFGGPVPDIGIIDLNWFHGTEAELGAMCGGPDESDAAPSEPVEGDLTPIDGPAILPPPPLSPSEPPPTEPPEEPEEKPEPEPRVPAIPEEPHMEPLSFWGRIFAFFAQLLQNKRADTTGKGR